MSEPEGGRVVRQLRHDVDDVYELLGEVAGAQRGHTNELGEVRQVLRQQGGRLDRLDEGLDRLDEGLDRVDGRLDRVDGRLDRVDGRLDRVDGRLVRVDGRLAGIEDVQRQILELVRGGQDRPDR